MVALFIFSSAVSASATSVTPYYSNSVSWNFFYDGYISFYSAHKVQKADSKYCKSVGKYIKRASIDYTRNGKSVCGGRKYTKTANSYKKGKFYSLTVNATGSLNPFAGKTNFSPKFYTF